MLVLALDANVISVLSSHQNDDRTISVREGGFCFLFFGVFFFMFCFFHDVFFLYFDKGKFFTSSEEAYHVCPKF